MKATLESEFGYRKVHVVRCDDGNGVDPVVPFGFDIEHLGIAAIGAIRGDADFERGGPGPCRFGGQCACDQGIAVVQASGDTMHGSDECTLATSDHAQTDALVSVRSMVAHGYLRSQSGDAKHVSVCGRI